MPSQANDRRYVALLAVAAGMILILGMWARPQKSAEDSSPATSPAEATRLQRLAQRRNVQEMASFFSEVAAEAARHLVRLREANRSAICWDSDGTLITSAAESSFPATTKVRTAEQWEAEAQTTTISPLSPVVALRVTASPVFQPVRTVAPNLLLPGDWLVAVARQADGRYIFAPGIYGGESPISCGEAEFHEVTWNVNFTDGMLGGALFDLDGNLLAMIVHCEGRLAAVAASDIPAALRLADSLDGQLLHRYGFRVEAREEGDSNDSAVPPVQGVPVTEVWSGSTADRAGLLPGDLLVKLDDRPVQSKQDLLPLVLPVAREMIEIAIRRGSRSMTMELSARGAPAPPDTPGARRGLAFGSKAGVVIDSVLPGSRAERAGLKSGDRVLLVNGRKVQNSASLQQLLARRSNDDVYVVAEREERKQLFVLK